MSGHGHAAIGAVKRYALFAADSHYPLGGWYDFVDSFDELDAAKSLGDDLVAVKMRPGPYTTPYCQRDFYHVIDLQTGAEVASG